jgi:hypothetical protein
MTAPTVGTGYLVARKLDPDGINSHMVDRNILDLKADFPAKLRQNS